MRASWWIIGGTVVGLAGLAATSIAGCKSSTGGSGGTSGTTVAGTTVSASSTKAATVSSTTASGSTTTAAGGTFITEVCTGIPTTAPSNGSCFQIPPTGSTSSGMTETLCNPVTASPCNVAGGETCDYAMDAMQYICFPSPNTATLCTMCDNQNSPYCGAGLSCQPADAAGDNKCAHFCCTDADCGGAAGSCEMGDVQSVGICGKKSM